MRLLLNWMLDVSAQRHFSFPSLLPFVPVTAPFFLPFQLLLPPFPVFWAHLPALPAQPHIPGSAHRDSWCFTWGSQHSLPALTRFPQPGLQERRESETFWLLFFPAEVGIKTWEMTGRVWIWLFIIFYLCADSQAVSSNWQAGKTR